MMTDKCEACGTMEAGETIMVNHDGQCVVCDRQIFDAQPQPCPIFRWYRIQHLGDRELELIDALACIIQSVKEHDGMSEYEVRRAWEYATARLGYSVGRFVGDEGDIE